MPRAAQTGPTTRHRILAAAADEFGARGFAGTRVDVIARRAQVNKAMIYYHFPSKQALYTSILRDIYGALSERLRAIVALPSRADQKLDALIRSFVEALDAHAHVLPMFLRELAEGGRHLGPQELSLIGGIFTAVTGVIADGVESKIFRPVHPALAHFSIIGPLIMFRATEPVRARLRQAHHVEIGDVDTATLIEHLQTVAHRMLAPVPERR
jgi:AcrR family transcriptional regulator